MEQEDKQIASTKTLDKAEVLRLKEDAKNRLKDFRNQAVEAIARAKSIKAERKAAQEYA